MENRENWKFRDKNATSVNFFIDHFVIITNALVGKKATKGSFKLKIQLFAGKIVLMLSTIMHLTKGTPHLKKEPIDDYSIYTLIRAFIETYLTFENIYVIPKTDEEKEFRHLVWDLTDTQRLISSNKFYSKESPLSSLIKAKILKRYKRLRKELESNKHFIKLSQKDKDKIILKSDARFDTNWQKIAVESGIESQFFRGMYSDLCSYAHSGCNAIIKSLSPNELQIKILEFYLSYIVLFFAMFIIDYCMLTDEANEALEKDKELVAALSMFVQSSSKNNIIVKDRFVNKGRHLKT
jgi:hypothetical protein